MARIRRHYIHISYSATYPQTCMRQQMHRTMFTCRRKLTLIASAKQKITVTHQITPRKHYVVQLQQGINQLSWCARNIDITPTDQRWRIGRRRFTVNLHSRNVLAYYQDPLKYNDGRLVPVTQLSIHVENTNPYQEDSSADEPLLLTTPDRGVSLKQLCEMSLLNQGPYFSNLRSITELPDQVVPRELKKITWISLRLSKVILEQPSKPKPPDKPQSGDSDDSADSTGSGQGEFIGNPTLLQPLEEQTASD